MYPYPLFWDIDLYTIFLCLGIAGAMLTYRFFAGKKKIYWKVQNLVVFTAALSIVGGYFSAVLFQAFYNIEKNGGFVIDEKTGATFYGGLIGGAAVFLFIYFVFGRFYVKNNEHVKSFFDVADIAAASIAVAHALGRIGCLMAGCCHGGPTDKWYGIFMYSVGGKAVPTQLYEAIFLFALFGFFVWRLMKNRSCNLPLYMAIYGVWRFFIEYVRKDYRGSTVVDFLSPSQFIAVLMIIGAVVLYFGQKAIMKKQQSKVTKEAIDEE